MASVVRLTLFRIWGGHQSRCASHIGTVEQRALALRHKAHVSATVDIWWHLWHFGDNETTGPIGPHLLAGTCSGACHISTGKTWQNMPSQDTIKIYQNTSCRCRLDPLNLLRKDSSKEQKVTESSFDSKSQFFSAGFFLHFVPSWKKESKGPSKKPNCRPHRFVIGAWFVRAILAVAIVVIDGGSCYLPIQDANWSVQTTANLKICSKLNNSNCKIFTSTYLSPLRSTSWPLQRKPWAYWPCISGATPDFINSHGLAVWHDEIWRVGWGWWHVVTLVLSAFCDEKQRRSFRWDSKKPPRGVASKRNGSIKDWNEAAESENE